MGASWGTFTRWFGLVVIVGTLACRGPQTPDPEPPVSTAPAAVEPTPAPTTCDDVIACVSEAEGWFDTEPGRSETRLKQCIRCETTIPGAYHLLAHLLLARQAPKEALQTLRAGTRRFPDNAQTWRTLGRVALAHGESRESMGAYQKAVDLKPEDTSLIEEFRAARARSEDPEARLETALEPLLEEAQARVNAQDFEQALDALDAALDIAKPQPRLRATVRHQKALVLIASGQPQKALRPLERGLSEATTPDLLRSGLLVSYADVLLTVGRPEEALIAAAAATDITPENALAWTDLGIARILTEDLSGAMTAFKTAFRQGLDRYITKDEFLAIEAIAPLKGRRAFRKMIRRAWPDPARAQ